MTPTTPTSAPGVSVEAIKEAMREKFEKWAVDNGMHDLTYIRTGPDRDYLRDPASICWQAWQDCAALLASAAGCDVHSVSSRICSEGTKGCIAAHVPVGELQGVSDLWKVAMDAFTETQDKRESIQEAWQRVADKVIAASRPVAVGVSAVPKYDPRMMYFEKTPGTLDMRIEGLSMRQIKDVFDLQYGELMWSEGSAYPCDNVKLQFTRVDLASTTKAGGAS